MASRQLSAKKPKDLGHTLRTLLSYLGRHKLLFLAVAVLVALSALANLLGTYMIRPVVNSLAAGSLNTLVLGVAVTAAIYGAGVLSALGYTQIMVKAAQKVLYDIRRDLFAHIQTLPLRFFDTQRHGDVMSYFTNDVDTISEALNNSFAMLIQSTIQVVGTFTMLFLLNWQLTLVVAVFYVLMFLYVRFSGRRSKAYYKKQQDCLGELDGYIEEMMAGQTVVKVFNRQAAMLEEAEALNEAQFRAQRRAQFADYAIYPAIRVLGQLGFIATAVLGGGMALGGAITLGTVQAFLQYVNQIAEPVTEASYVITSLQAAIAGAERVFALLDEEEERPDAAGDASVITQGHVEFRHVRFGYTPERTLIHDLNLEVRPNEMVAIVGPTGGGKTTLVNLLMRFYELDGGSISIDGQDITALPRGKLRRRIGMVLQDAWLFEGTIAENIAYGRRDATREEIVAAARAACCDHFIRTLPQGYDTPLSGETTGVSQGQMQLLTIARAMLTDPAILVLDEATSSVDTRTEVEIQKAMARLMEGKTSFVIAHRLSTIRSADLILVVRDGDIVERGTHRELMARNGFYASLYRSQFEAA